ncbi:hypothetical protein [Candidatus Stoquefichus massiliensis]|uniref:hypothetical protein n=1 Tax=Candidatus Stoquefichus massiliensis TaxID=1470350 RepID=UPI000485ACAC|nr:hypothetical protein [Candidatus Stoquefichus massiliensis]
MHLKNKTFLILGILGILIVIVFCNHDRTSYQIKNEINTVVLTVYGMSEEPVVYSLDDEDSIESLIQRVNNMTQSDKKLMNEKELDKPKGVSYKLEFLGKTNYEYTIVYDYCICNEDVYAINNYDAFMNDLKAKFHF